MSTRRPYGNELLARVALAAAERRRELGMSRRDAARCGKVAARTVARIEAGLPIDPQKLLRYAGALMVLEAHQPPPLETSLMERVHRDEQLSLPEVLLIGEERGW